MVIAVEVQSASDRRVKYFIITLFNLQELLTAGICGDLDAFRQGRQIEGRPDSRMARFCVQLVKVPNIGVKTAQK